jgi:flagellar basal body-associated protein FliL
MAKRSDKEYFVAFTVLIVLILLFAGFYFTWAAKKGLSPVAYAKFDSVLVTNQTYTIKTDISIQTASKDQEWLMKHKTAIGDVLKNTLANADPRIVTGANGLFILQESMKSTVNKAFKTTSIQNVFFTDFVLVMNGSQ